MPVDDLDGLMLPTPSDGRLWYRDNERAPDSLKGSFQVLPPEAFTSQIITRTFYLPYNYDDGGSSGNPLKEKIAEILGYATYNTSTLVRFLPWVDSVNFPHLVASRVDFRGIMFRGQDPDSDPDTLPPSATANRYKWIETTVHYQSPRFKLYRREDYVSANEPGISQVGLNPTIETQRYCTREKKPGITYITAKPGPFVWTEDKDGNTFSGTAAQINFQIPQVESFCDHIVTWLAVPLNAYPFTAIDKCLGKTNADTLIMPNTIKSDTFSPATLVLHSHGVIDGHFPTGERLVHVIYVFKEKPITEANPFGWQGLPFPGNGTYRKIGRAGDTTKGLFLTADFDALFMPEP